MFLVTGANGLLGSFICRHLLSKHIPFKALVRENSDLSLLNDIEEDICFVKGDVCDIYSLEDALESVETVIHTAAVVSFHASDEANMYHVNVQGTANLVNACLKSRVPNLVHVSSIAALGRNKHIKVIDENVKWENSDLNTAYAKSKYLSELEVWRGHMEGLKVIVVNPSVILGPGDFNKSSTQIFKFAWEEKPYYTSGSLNFIDVRDVTDIIWQLIQQEKYRERYILNNDSVSYKEILNLIAENFGKKKPKLKVPPFLLHAAVIWEGIRSFFSRSKPLLTKESLQLTRKAFAYSNEKIVTELNHKFIPLEDTIRWTCQEFIKKKHSKNLHFQLN